MTTIASPTSSNAAATTTTALGTPPSPLPNNAILDSRLKLFRLRKSSGGTIAKGAFGIYLSPPSSDNTDSTTSNDTTVPLDETLLHPNDQQEQVVITNSDPNPSSPNDMEDEENLKEENQEGEEDVKIDNNHPDDELKREKTPPDWYLFIEEAIYLHERGLLDVHDEKDKKMQSYDLYKLLPDHGMPLPIYLVYAHLRQQTFRVVRYSAERRQILQQQMAYMQQETEQTEHQKEQKEKDNQTDVKEEKTTTTTPPQEKKRPPNFALQLRRAAAEARPPPWDDLARHLAWDVYPPNGQYVRRKPGAPAFAVLVTSHTVPFAMERIQELVQENDPIPIKLATMADTGTVILFGVTNIGAPSMVDPLTAGTSGDDDDMVED